MALGHVDLIPLAQKLVFLAHFEGHFLLSRKRDKALSVGADQDVLRAGVTPFRLSHVHTSRRVVTGSHRDVRQTHDPV